TGGLFGIELAQLRPDTVACVVALSPPAPTQDWQDHVARFFNSGTLDLPDLWGFGWFNGGAALAQLDSAHGTRQLEALRRAPSVRLQLTAITRDPTSPQDLPPVLTLYGEDETAQYPD